MFKIFMSPIEWEVCSNTGKRPKPYHELIDRTHEHFLRGKLYKKIRNFRSFNSILFFTGLDCCNADNYF